MIGFWVFAAVLAGLALWIIVPALTRSGSDAAALDEGAGNLAVLREQLAQANADFAGGAIDAAQHALARRELERRVLEEEGAVERGARRGPARRTALALAVGLPLFAVALYGLLGQPAALLPQRPGASAAPNADGASQQDVEAMVDKLARRMQAEPGDPKGWAMLARAYAALQRFDDASAAFAKAVALAPDDGQLLADYADALAMTQGQNLAGEPTALVERALKADPDNLKALALAGSAAMERKDFAAAVAYWQRALKRVQPGSELATAIERSLNDAQAAAAQAPAGTAAAQPAAAGAASSPGVAVASGASAAGIVSGRVRLAPALAARVQPGDTVFIFARAVDGPRMPLAIVRRTAADLPAAFTLDDAQAMSAETRLSKFAQVVVAARISRSGDAMPRSGDLQGQSGPVAVGSTGLDIVIDHVQP